MCILWLWGSIHFGWFMTSFITLNHIGLFCTACSIVKSPLSKIYTESSISRTHSSGTCGHALVYDDDKTCHMHLLPLMDPCYLFYGQRYEMTWVPAIGTVMLFPWICDSP
jgi:hypothetical protein